jgi:hypothetical protein
MAHSSIYQILRRSTDPKTHMKDLWSLLTYLSYNPLFRDELLKKHGMKLGYRGQERPASFQAGKPFAMSAREGLRATAEDAFEALFHRPTDWVRKLISEQ